MSKIDKFFLVAVVSAFLSGCTGQNSAQDAALKWYPNREYHQSLNTPALEAEADSGSIEATLKLAMRLMTGDRTALDQERGFKLIERFAKAGDARAQHLLGTAYTRGSGTDADPKVAIEWFRKSAQGGYDMGQYWYAFMLSRGRGVEQANWKSALPWFQKAAEQGNQDAQFTLGEIYESCRAGQDRDFEKAAYWYRRADGPQDSMAARYNLRRLIDLGLVEWKDGDSGGPPETLISMDKASFPPCEENSKDPLSE